MPYTIEVFKGDRLVNIETDKVFDTKDQALAAIVTLNAEQVQMNEEIDEIYANELEVFLSDEETNDRTPRRLPYYDYAYKAAKYSKRAIAKMP